MKKAPYSEQDLALAEARVRTALIAAKVPFDHAMGAVFWQMACERFAEWPQEPMVKMVRELHAQAREAFDDGTLCPTCRARLPDDTDDCKWGCSAGPRGVLP